MQKIEKLMLCMVLFLPSTALVSQSDIPLIPPSGSLMTQSCPNFRVKETIEKTHGKALWENHLRYISGYPISYKPVYLVEELVQLQICFDWLQDLLAQLKPPNMLCQTVELILTKLWRPFDTALFLLYLRIEVSL